MAASTTVRSAATGPSIALTPETLSGEAGPSAEDLLVATARGDDPAFELLARRVRPQVVRVAERVVRDPSIAEEVAQEVLTEVWRKAERFDPSKGSVSAWVSTLARRRAVDRVRSEQASRNRDDRIARRSQERDFDVVADEVELRL